jgi:hypothetical protein
VSRPLDVILSSLVWRRSQIQLVTTDTERVALQLEVDALLDELAQRNATLIAERAAKAGPS